MKYDFLHPELDRRLEEAKGRIEGSSSIRVVSHSDGDGVFAAASIIPVLDELGAEYHVSLLMHPDSEELSRIVAEEYDLYLILDLGNAWEVADRENVVILDHHQTSEDAKRALFVNPTLFGADGGREVCASTLSFLLASLMGREDLAPNFVAGCMADKQVPMEGINLHTFTKFSDGFRVRRWLAFPDFRASEALAYSTEPYIRGLAGNKEKSGEFLSRLGIKPEKRITELSESEARDLASSIVAKLAIQGASYEGLESVVEEEFSFGDRHINTESRIVHLLARRGMGGVALTSVLEGNVLREEIKNAYTELEAELVSFIESSRVEDRGSIYLVRAAENAPTGRIAEVYLHYILGASKPVVALSVEEGRVKFSLRASRKHAINLGVAAREAARVAGGQGGGHPLAAGASVPLGKEEEFVSSLLEKISGFKS